MEQRKIRSYSQMMNFDSYIDRFKYLRINDGKIGATTFGSHRYLNQQFYQSDSWINFTEQIKIRDSIDGYICDLGCEGYEIDDRSGIVIVVHHINPITIEQIMRNDPCLTDPENAITCTKHTHNAIHYGNEHLLCSGPTERKPGDTKLW